MVAFDPPSQKNDSAVPAPDGKPTPPAAEAAGLEAATLGGWLRHNGISLLVFIAVFVALYWWVGGDGVWRILKAALGLGFVIFIHELGHFAVAKWCDVYVETFSIGFGPALPGCSFRRGETLYKLALFPLGGYVKMLGENPEGEEEDDNPRSFKNKPVGQRMAIISAGVVMNVLLGGVFFVWIYLAHGEYRTLGVIGSVDPGSPAWEKGVQSDSRIQQIGDVEDPHYDNIVPAVAFTSADEKVQFVYVAPPEQLGQPGKVVRTELEPRREKDGLMPVIGVAMSSDLRLMSRGNKRFAQGVLAGSPAARAEPEFKPGDLIVGTTDPDNPEQIKPIPSVPLKSDEMYLATREYRQRMERLAGQPITIQVQRKEADSGLSTINIRVQPAFYYTPGLRMRMGQITAVRQNSPAAEKGIRTPNRDKRVEGDIIDRVEITEASGKKLRFVTSPRREKADDVEERELDPSRLPYELKQWAERTPGKKTVTLTVIRNVGQGAEPVTLTLDWHDEWRNNKEEPNYRTSPLSIAPLGLAYRIDSVVAGVRSGSPADKAGVQPGDVIKAVRFFQPGKDGADPKTDEWITLKPDEQAQDQERWERWATIFLELQNTELKQMTLRLERDNETKEVVVTAEPDLSWPRAERGVTLAPLAHLDHADGNFFRALAMGYDKTKRSIVSIYLSLKAMIVGRISHKSVGGPIMIATMAYDIAGENFYEFLMFLALISVNLAVINFLPIPLLDGGHMVFLIYEKLRGKPAPERVLNAAFILGIAVILFIFLFASYQDVVRRWFP